jgi:hypothetical protein
MYRQALTMLTRRRAPGCTVHRASTPRFQEIINVEGALRRTTVHVMLPNVHDVRTVSSPITKGLQHARSAATGLTCHQGHLGLQIAPPVHLVSIVAGGS